MASKRNFPEHDTPPKDHRFKRNKKGVADTDSAPSFCLVCSKVIVVYNPDKSIEGDDAMYCEGICNAWVHRTCVGLSKQSYEALAEDDTPYLCPHCHMKQQSTVIEGLGTNSHIDSAFTQLENRLLSSLQEMITTSIASLKSTIESEVKVLHSIVCDLTERVQTLESSSEKVDKLSDRLQLLENKFSNHPSPLGI